MKRGTAILLLGFFAAGGCRNRGAPSPPPEERESTEGVIVLDPQALAASGVSTAPLNSLRHVREIAGTAVVVRPAELAETRTRLLVAEGRNEATRAALAAAEGEMARIDRLHNEDRARSDKALEGARAELALRSAEAAEAREARTLAATEATGRWGPSLTDRLLHDPVETERVLAGTDLVVEVGFPPGETPAAAPPRALVRWTAPASCTGILLSVPVETDPRFQGGTYLYLLHPAPPGLLGGRNLEAFLPEGQETQGVAVPAEAAVWLRGRAWVYVERGAGRFRRTPFPPDDPLEGGGWFVPSGLAPGTRVVVVGAQTLLSDEQSSTLRGE